MPSSPDPTPRRSWLLALSFTALALAGCGSAPRSPGRARAGGGGPTTVRSALSPQQQHDIAIHALGLVGTPYRYGGNTPEGGFDCSGLIGYVYRSGAGLSAPRTVAQLAGFGQAVSTDQVQTGDLVLFGGGRPSHAGIYVGEGRFVHAPSTGGTVRLDRLAGPYWSRQPLAVRRL